MKIGRAADVEARLRQLQTGCPAELKIMARIKCRDVAHAVQVERAAHSTFAKHRIRGEWFRCTDYITTLAYGYEHATA